MLAMPQSRTTLWRSGHGHQQYEATAGEAFRPFLAEEAACPSYQDQTSEDEEESQLREWDRTAPEQAFGRAIERAWAGR